MRPAPANHAAGVVGTEGEFFAIMLRDTYARAALHAYAIAALADDFHYGVAVDKMAGRAGPASPYCKRPD